MKLEYVILAVAALVLFVLVVGPEFRSRSRRSTGRTRSRDQRRGEGGYNGGQGGESDGGGGDGGGGG